MPERTTLIPEEIWDKINRNYYYIMVAVVSVLALFVLPLLGSASGLSLNLPDTTAGWIVFGTTRIAVAALNILIFHCFVQQGRINIMNDPRYLAAREKGLSLSLDIIKEADEKPARSPRQYYREIYGKKSVMVFASSMMSAVALSQAILTFDWVAMLTYFATILGGVICGILQMKDTENFWTMEYNRYLAEQELLLATNTSSIIEETEKENEIPVEEISTEEGENI